MLRRRSKKFKRILNILPSIIFNCAVKKLSLCPEEKFLSLASGSSGNCYYLGNEEYGILIDAGKGVRTIKKVLKEYGIPFEKIVALCITHDHADHIKAAGTLGEKYGIPIYTTEAIKNGMIV